MLARHAQSAVETALRDTPVVLVHGPRQAGKSTLCRAIGRDVRRYVTLDDPVVLGSARADPLAFLGRVDGPVVIDEVQRAPELFPVIKLAVDESRVPGRFLLTGSCNVLLVPALAESLAGRIEIVRLHPLSQGEFAGRRESFVDRVFADAPPEWRAESGTRTSVGAADLDERISRGGFPEAALERDGPRRAVWFSSYLQAILQRDVRDLGNVEQLAAMPRLVQLLAARSGGLMNIADLGRDAGIPVTTLRRYLSMLEAIFLIVPLRPWSTNAGQRLVRAPKVIIADTGLALALLGIERAHDADPAVAGRLLESFVALELLKQLSWRPSPPSLMHFRTHAGREVDLVLEDRAGAVVGIEVKSATTVRERDFAGLRALAELAGPRFRRGILLHRGAQTLPFGPSMMAAPIEAVWSGEDASLK